MQVHVNVVLCFSRTPSVKNVLWGSKYVYTKVNTNPFKLLLTSSQKSFLSHALYMALKIHRMESSLK